MKRLPVVVLLFAAAAVLAAALLFNDRPPSPTAEESAGRGGHRDDVSGSSASVLGDSRDPAALLLAGEAAARAGELEKAIRSYDAISDDAGSQVGVARFASGQLRFHLGRLSEAESDYQEAIDLSPSPDAARTRLAKLLIITGRRREAGPHLLELVKRDQNDIDHLCLLGDPLQLVTDEATLQGYIQNVPDDPLPRLGLARLAMDQEEFGKAEPLLRKLVDSHPNLIEAQVRLGELLARRGEAGLFLAWHERLPQAAEAHPHLWHARGLFAASHEQPEPAARCFWECLRREPNHAAAVYQLANVLTRLGRAEEARRFGERARDLQRVTVLMNLLHKNPTDAGLVREAVELMEKTGRIWETRGWLRVAELIDASDPWFVARRSLITSPPPRDTPQTPDQAAPASWADFSSYPLPDWAAARRPVAGGEAATGSAVRFDVADAGIDFRFFSSPDPATPGVRMFEFTGGGVAAIDYEADGRPDLHFTQGCRWPADPGQREHLDRLYRNVGGRFEDVTVSATLVEPGYSQGAAAGDFDGDGLADLYVADIGTNRLFRNNGDGTFSDVTDASGLLAGPLADAWTVSAAVADLNGDGLPDLFDVNYLQGENVYELICGQDGATRACTPTSFEGQPDRLLLNRGDGTFENVTGIAGVDAPQGNGLGLVAADFDGSGRLSLFVANDATNNHFYANVTDSPGGPPRFEERALVNGLAYDRDGRPQACMGVAAGDADGDGRLDLFVTNYVDESNTLYRQQAEGLFVDDSRPAGLTEPSFDMLGFGTQFLDADLDGREDLVVTNGHVDDFAYKGYAYRMPSQAFRNLGGRFAEVPAAELGPFFESARLGRGLARLDWNGDGRDDFAVSLLEDPAVLLTNASASAGRPLSLHLRATSTAREAIGSVVEVTSGGRRLVRQLTAGDGYAASNERKLVFGLDEAGPVELVDVRWPSGRRERFGDLAAGAEWLIVEGRGRGLRLPSRAPSLRTAGPVGRPF